MKLKNDDPLPAPFKKTSLKTTLGYFKYWLGLSALMFATLAYLISTSGIQ